MIKNCLFCTVLLMLCCSKPFFIKNGPTNLEYHISILSVSEQTLSIKLTLDRLPKDCTSFRLSKESLDISFVNCLDAQKRKTELDISNGYVDVWQFRTAMPVTISYVVKIGSNGRHGHNGALYNDFFVFDGERVLLLPELSANISDSSLGNKIASITIENTLPPDWAFSVPYPAVQKSKKIVVTQVKNPTYFDLSQIVKSCYVMGKFTSITVPGNSTKSTILIDPLLKPFFTDSVLLGIASLYNYYENLFGIKQEGFKPVFLRPSIADSNYIMGGVGVNAIVSTFDPANVRDWELLSHRFFHAYFDAAMPVSLFHKAPQVWLYEGLATYYESMALQNLPIGLQQSLAISISENFRELAQRYALLWLKDSRFRLTPMNEAAFTSLAFSEFLHYTQAPLIIKLLEDNGCSKFGGKNRLVGYLLKNYTTMQSIEPAIKYAVVDNFDAFLKSYIFGSSILPVWVFGASETVTAVIADQLHQFDNSMNLLIGGNTFSDSNTSQTISNVDSMGYIDSIKNVFPTVVTKLLSINVK